MADEDHDQLVKDCEAREERLTKWERNFIQSCRERLDNNLPLTKPMIEALDEVWEKATAKG